MVIICTVVVVPRNMRIDKHAKLAGPNRVILTLPKPVVVAADTLRNKLSI